MRLTREAHADLERLFDFILERELDRADGDLELAEQAIAAIHAAVQSLKVSPFICRKAGLDPLLRELVISFGRSGYVALFEIVGMTDVVVSAVRHQLEDDYH